MFTDFVYNGSLCETWVRKEQHWHLVVCCASYLKSCDDGISDLVCSHIVLQWVAVLISIYSNNIKAKLGKFKNLPNFS